MAGQKPSPERHCNTTEESKPHDINDTGYNEAPAQYMANTEKGFWKTIKGIFNKEKK